MAELKVEYIDPDTLKPFAGNPREHSTRNIQDIQRSIKKFGFTNPILVRKEDHMVIAGHGRLQSAQELGVEEVPVIFLDFSENDAKLYSVTDNRTGETSEWDHMALTDLLEELGTQDHLDLEDSGFDALELDQLLEETGFEGPEVEERPTDDLGGFNITDFQNTVKQLILYFDGSEYPEILERLDQAREAEGLPDNSQLFLELLKFYEENRERAGG